jgi:fatty acid desaturase
MKDTVKQTREGFFYSPHLYELNKDVLEELKALKPYRPVLAALQAWFWIFVIVKAFLYSPQLVYFYPIVIFLIAGRAGVFLQLAHEAGHRLIASNAKFNDWFGNWIATYPIGLDLRGYAVPHTRHHACPNRPCDPVSDSEKYKVCDIRSPKLWFLFLKDLLGITAVTIRFLYQQPLSNKEKKDIEDYLETNDEKYLACRTEGESSWQALKKYLSIGAVQLVVLGALFNFNLIHYFILWIVPLTTAHMFLMRVRGIAEHGLGIQLQVSQLDQKNRGTLYTRSFGTPANHYAFPLLTFLDRILIGSLNVYYHHEHHLFPKVPYYNLPRLHQLIYEREKQFNPQIFAKGYFSCLFFNLRHQPALS